jgi:hypothetical protein
MASAFGGTVTYDSNNLSFTGATSGAATSDWAAVSGNENNPGEITFGGFRGAGTQVDGDDNEIVILNFDCITCPTVTVIAANSLTDALSGAQITNGTATCGEFPEVIVGSASSQCGAGTVNIPVTMNNADMVSAFGGTLTYDPTSITFEGATAGAATSDWAAVSANEGMAGTITLGGFRGAGTVVNDDSNEMIVLQFSCDACNVGEDSNTALTLSNTTDGWATATLTPGNLECLSEDTTDPTAVCQDITVQLDANGMATITPADIDNGSSDDTTATPDLVLSLDVTSFDCSNVGDNTVTLTVTDEAGNSATCQATVTVEDVENPTLTTQNIALDLNASGAASITAADVIAAAADNCGIASSSVSPNTFDCGDIGPNTVTVTVMDPSGNMAQQTATVTISDNTDPVVTCPGDVTLDLDANCEASVPDFTGGANATDNCSVASVTQSPAAGTTITADTTVTITATDGEGNTDTCTVDITVQDVTDPVITCPGDVTLDLDASCEASVPDLTAGATATDNCGTATVTQDPAAGTTITADTVVTLTATDDAGNTATCTVSITVQDVTDPVITCPGDVSVDLDTNCEASVPDLAGQATASDNCGDPTVTQDPAAGTVITADTVVTLTATDDAGNTATCTVTVSVADNTDPSIALLGDATVTLTCGDSFSDAGAAASDNCDGDLTSSIVVGGDTVDPDTAGTYTVTYSVTDSAGNSASVDRTVVVVADTEAPVITLAGADPQVLDCGVDAVDPGASATDNCDADVTVTSDYDTVVVTDETRTFTVTYTATDSEGNTSSEFRTVIVDGDSCPPDGTIEGEAEEVVCEDADGNGYIDNPFGCDTATTITIDTTAGQRTVVTQPFDTTSGANAQVSVPVPGDKQGQTVTVSVPTNLLFPGEQGILVVAAADSLAALFDDAADATALGATLPANVVSDTPYAEVSVLVSSNGGATFDEIEDMVTDITQPSDAWIQFSGISLDDETEAVFNSHPTDVVSDPVTGISVAASTQTDADWNNDGNETLSQTADTLRARVSTLSVYAAFQGPPVPTIATVPSADFDYVVGIVQVGQTQGGNTITVMNTGTGTVNGTASLSTNPDGVFSLVGTTAYSLASGESTTIEVSFAPLADEAYTGELTLTGGDNGPLTITLLGSGTTVVKTGLFGCSPATGVTGSPLGDLSFVALVLLALVAASRAYRSSRQNG